MTFDNLLGYILSISMSMQSFITIVHSVRPFSLYQNLELCTALTDIKCHFAISWARFGNPSVMIMSIVTIEGAIERTFNSCHTCLSLQTFPDSLVKQTSEDPPESIENRSLPTYLNAIVSLYFSLVKQLPLTQQHA